jgi:GNAT superfamily N-acetyltransferase
MASRLASYWDDVRMLPRDVWVAWHHGGPVELLLTLLERSVFRVLWGGRFLVVRAPVQAAKDASPQGVMIERLTADRLDELTSVSTAPRMRLFRALARAGALCIVARRSGRVVGYVWAVHAGPAAQSAYLRSLPAGLPCVRSLFVARQERGHGVATALLAALADHGPRTGFDLAPACCALVRPGNAASLRTIASITGGKSEVIGRVVQLKVLWWVWGWGTGLAEQQAIG